MDEQKLDDQLQPIYNSSVPIQDVALKTSRGRWTIETGDGIESLRSVPAARHDDDDDDSCCPLNHLSTHKPLKMSLISLKTHNYFSRRHLLHSV